MSGRHCVPFLAQPDNLRLLDAIGHRYGQRPSQILEIVDPWTAYQVDLAALVVGRDGRRETSARGSTRGNRPRQYGSLRGIARKVKVPASGIW